VNVRPASPDLLLRDPVSKKALPAIGGRVPDSTFWRRRLMRGDVVLTEGENQ
jgi:hypothetical protein